MNTNIEGIWCVIWKLLMRFLSIFRSLKGWNWNNVVQNLLATPLNIIVYDRFSIMKPFYLSVSWSRYRTVEDSRSTWINNLMLWSYVGREIWMNFKDNLQFKLSILVGCFANLKMRLSFNDKKSWKGEMWLRLPIDQHLDHQRFLWEEASAME